MPHLPLTPEQRLLACVVVKGECPTCLMPYNSSCLCHHPDVDKVKLAPADLHPVARRHWNYARYAQLNHDNQRASLHTAAYGIALGRPDLTWEQTLQVVGVA